MVRGYRMKCLSIRLPWAEMVRRGEKTIETRTWSTDYRGELFLHASRSPDPRGPSIFGLPNRCEIRGCIFAVTELVDCRPMIANDVQAAMCAYHPDLWAWIFEDIRSIKPIPIRGRLRIFNVHYVDSMVEFRRGRPNPLK